MNNCTTAMRDRIRELATPPRDDFDIAVIALLDDTEWQPIETAPTGEDDFFLVCGIEDERSPFVVRGSIMASARRPNTPSHLHLHYLTHWMLLPRKPGTDRLKRIGNDPGRPVPHHGSGP